MVSNTTMQDRAARYLAAARRADMPCDRLPLECRPSDLETALAIQQQVGQLLGEETGGWKCALPPVDRLTIAPIYASAIHHASPCAVHAAGGIVRVEPEIALVLDLDLLPRQQPYGEDEVLGAIREVRLALELIGCRYADPSQAAFPELLADGLFNQGLYLGPAVPDGLSAALEAFTLSFEGALCQTVEGRHPDGHPLKPLHWLANFLSRRGDGLRAGQAVTTGSYAGVFDVPLGQPLAVRFGALGTLQVELVSVTAAAVAISQG